MENERLAKLEERAKSNTKRLDEHDKKIEDIHDLTYSIKELAIEVKNMREDVNEIGNRVNLLEEKPSKNWDKVVNLIITRYSNSCTGLFFRKIGIVGGEKNVG